MALLFMDGFEMGDGALKWDSVTSYGTANTSPRVTTNGGYYFHPTSTPGTVSKTIATSARVTVGMAVRLSSINTNDTIFSFGYSGGGGGFSPLWIGITSGGNLQAIAYAGGFSSTTLGTGTTQLLPNIWYYIEAQALIDSTNGKIEVRINGVSTPDINFTGNTNLSGSSTTTIGSVYSTVTGDLDDYYILNDTGATNTTFLGDVRVYALKPNGNGSYSQLTGSDGDSVNNYQLVGEQPYNTANYVGSATSGLRDTYALADVPANVTTVLGLQNNLIAAKSDAGTISMKPVMKIGSNLYYGATRSPNTVYGGYQDMYNINPDTSANWTITDVNNLESGMEVV